MKPKTLILALCFCLFIKKSNAYIGLGLIQYIPGKTISATHKSTIGYEINYKTGFQNYSRFNISFNYTNLKPAFDTVYQTISTPPMPGSYTNKLVYDNMKMFDLNVGADFTPSIDKDINPYVGFQIGITNYDYTFSTYQDGTYGSFKRGIAETSALIKLGAGVNFMINDKVMIDLDYRYHFDFYKNSKGLRNSTLGLSVNWKF
jgi:outer membrane autotransporter protein